MAVVVRIVEPVGVHSAGQHALGLGVARIGRIHQRAAPGQLEPVPGEFVVIRRGGHDDLVAQRHLVHGVVALVIVLHLVDQRQPVTAVGIATEIDVGEPQVGLIGVFRGVLRLEQHALALALPAQLGHVILYIETGVGAGAIDILEAVAAPLGRLQQGPELAAAQAVAGQHIHLIVLSIGQVQLPGVALGYGGGDQVDDATRGLRAVAQQWCPLEYLDGLHTQGGRKIVGLGVRVGCRGNQHPVLHQGDARRALRGGAANTDVGTQAVAVLFHDIDAGHGFEQLVDIPGGLDHHLLVVDDRPRAGQGPGIVGGADNGHLLEYPVRRQGPGAAHQCRQGRRKCPLVHISP